MHYMRLHFAFPHLGAEMTSNGIFIRKYRREFVKLNLMMQTNRLDGFNYKQLPAKRV